MQILPAGADARILSMPVPGWRCMAAGLAFVEVRFHQGIEKARFDTLDYSTKKADLVVVV